MSEFIRFEEVEKRIITVREQQVLIDRDVAELYGVETKYINRAVRNNLDKFPKGYVINLSTEERSEVVQNLHHLSVLKYSHAETAAFTEKGLYMLATILKSPVAVQTTIAIVETFSKLRELSTIISTLPKEQDEDKQQSLILRSGEIISEIIDETILDVIGDETSFELNLGAIKVKRTVKREKRKN
ncbi:MAG: ORF6N domain-containing protein [Oscillospiraceae bacterium]|nr:ORF6N domain-containing protein [Oscillospiraceae bacterium]